MTNDVDDAATVTRIDTIDVAVVGLDHVIAVAIAGALAVVTTKNTDGKS